MRAILVSLGACVLLNFTTSVANAAPNSTFTWTAPTQYEDGTMIPASDVLSYRLYCGNTAGGPYNNSIMFSSPSPSQEDMAFCVGGTPGTYYMVATAISTNGEESAFSNETMRTYTAGDLGKIPLPPTLLQVQ